MELRHRISNSKLYYQYQNIRTILRLQNRPRALALTITSLSGEESRPDGGEAAVVELVEGPRTDDTNVDVDAYETIIAAEVEEEVAQQHPEAIQDETPSHAMVTTDLGSDSSSRPPVDASTVTLEDSQWTTGSGEADTTWDGGDTGANAGMAW